MKNIRPAREATDPWLRHPDQQARFDAISAYAAEVAGTSLDLDRDLESAGIEHLIRPSIREE